jgi:anti-sigma factor RsiW
MSCAELVELVTDYLEGALPAERRRLFEQHLATCDACTAYLGQLERTRRALGTLSERSIAPDARVALLHAFRDWRAA